jgi:hypothetical protein
LNKSLTVQEVLLFFLGAIVITSIADWFDLETRLTWLMDGLVWSTVFLICKNSLQLAVAPGGHPNWPNIGKITASICIFLAAIYIPTLLHKYGIAGNLYPNERGALLNILRIFETYALVVTLLIAAIFIFWWRETKQTHGVGIFTREIGLIKGATGGAATHEYIMDVQKEIAKKIQKKELLRVMVINGVQDFVEDSPINEVLKGSKCPKLRVLLLDPFSSFARDRADRLRNDDDLETCRRKYVWDFVRTKEFLESLKRTGKNVDYRIYCSRPLFRMYLGEDKNGNHWCTQQSYLVDKHGYEAPVFFHEFTHNGQVRQVDSFATLAKQAFQYLWDRGFESYTKIGIKSTPLVYYMANMYDIPLKSPDGSERSVGELKQAVVNYANQQFQEAKDYFTKPQAKTVITNDRARGRKRKV